MWLKLETVHRLQEEEADETYLDDLNSLVANIDRDNSSVLQVFLQVQTEIADSPLQSSRLPMPQLWRPNLLHCLGLDIPSLGAEPDSDCSIPVNKTVEPENEEEGAET